MAYRRFRGKRSYQKKGVKRSYRRAKGVRVHRRGGYGGTNTRRAKGVTRQKTFGPRGKRHTRYQKASLNPRKALAIANALAPSGVITFAGQTERVAWTAGNQGFSSDQSDSAIMGKGDIANVIAGIILRTTADAVAAPIYVEPRFWIQRAMLKMVVVNNSQVGFSLRIVMRCCARPHCSLNRFHNPHSHRLIVM